MFPATVLTAALLAAVLVLSSVGLVRRDERTMDLLDTVRATALAPVLAAVGVAGAAGLLVGLAVAPIGVAAAAAVTAYMAGALIAHLRVGDTTVGPPVAIGLLAIASLLLRLLTT
jgi:hypothetical protein